SNTSSISVHEQERLLGSFVARVGLGGLGWNVLENLARLGVRCIRAAEGDVFEASNMNRQLLAEEPWLDGTKNDSARERAARINPSVGLEVLEAFLDEPKVADFLQGSYLAVECLCGLYFRAPLHPAATAAGIAMVTGAVAGWCGYVGSVAPGAPGTADLLSHAGGVEDTLGTPAPTVMLAASLQARECVRLLLGGTAEPTVLLFDLSDG
ncbi:HesA/MoeB/ThiF family protein, partial [Oceanidesulfovibrio marinus]